MAALVTDSGRKSPARFAGSAILASQSDERLVKLVRAGHERAFEAIVERYRKPLVRFCSRILPESRCEDAVQQAFLNAHAALLASDEPVQLKPWLYRITRNAALNMLRQNGWNYEQIPQDFDGVRRPDQVVEERIELQQTVAAVNDLPERQRDALVMREFEGRSYDEIALALGANDGAVRQLLNRARVTLRSAASALIPGPLVARAAASMPPSDGRRLAEIVSGLGAAGVAKAGATALVAGTLVVGAVKAPLPVGEGHKTTHEKATLAADKPGVDKAVSAHDTPVSLRNPAAGPHTTRGSGDGHAIAHKHSGRGRSTPVKHEGERHESRRRSGADRRQHSGSDDGTRPRSGSDDSRTSGSDDRSGTSGGGSDEVATLLGSDSSGTSGDSGTSGSGSGSGSDGLVATTDSGSGSSGSDDSGTSGSGSSGSSDGVER